MQPHLQKYILIGAMVLAVLIGLSLFIFGGRDTTLLAPRSVAMVFPVKPDVSLSFDPSDELSDFTTISTTTEVTSGTSVKTGPVGRAIIEGVHTTVINSDTEIKIFSNETDIQFLLIAGDLWARSAQVVDGGYQAETENVVATVRGTSFGLSFLNSASTLLVTEGLVLLFPRDDGNTVFDRGVLVRAGEKAVRRGREEISTSTISALDRATEWFRSNNLVAVPASTLPNPSTNTNTTPKPLSNPQLPSTPPPPTNSPPIPQFTLTALYPKEVVAESGVLLTVSGSGFSRLKTLFIGPQPVKPEALTDTKVNFILPNNFEPGVYDVAVIDLENHVRTLPGALLVTRPMDKPTDTQLPSSYTEYNRYYYTADDKANVAPQR